MIIGLVVITKAIIGGGSTGGEITPFGTKAPSTSGFVIDVERFTRFGVVVVTDINTAGGTTAGVIGNGGDVVTTYIAGLIAVVREGIFGRGSGVNILSAVIVTATM